MVPTATDMLAPMSRSRMFFVALLVVALAACARAPMTTADRARGIEGQVWSPYCPGRLLIDCTTPQARTLRDRIQHRIEDGQTDAEVLGWIRGNFGDEALARPRANGAGLAIWLVPAVLFAMGAIVLGGLVRRWTHTRAEEPGPPSPRGGRRLREEVERDL
jgi:cytochrome c-type biogenesis protein CcmH